MAQRALLDAALFALLFGAFGVAGQELSRAAAQELPAASPRLRGTRQPADLAAATAEPQAAALPAVSSDAKKTLAEGIAAEVGALSGRRLSAESLDEEFLDELANAEFLDEAEDVDDIDGNHADLAAAFRVPVYLGDRVHIQNLNRGREGRGFLDVTDGKQRCEGNAACISAAASSDRNLSSGTWQVLLTGSVGSNASSNASDPGHVLESGAEVHLQSLYRGPQGRTFLDIRKKGCEGNHHCISGADSPDREAGSGTWELIRAAGPGPIYFGDEVYIRSKLDGPQGRPFLETRKFGCEGNRHCVSATSNPNRERQAASWSFVPVFVKETQ